MRLYCEFDVRTYECCTNAQNTVDMILENGKAEVFNSLMDDIFPNGCTDQEMDDYLSNEDDSIRELLGIKSNEEEAIAGHVYKLTYDSTHLDREGQILVALEYDSCAFCVPIEHFVPGQYLYGTTDYSAVREPFDREDLEDLGHIDNYKMEVSENE